MGVEIERKFLVKDDRWKTGPGVEFRQGYLNRDKERTVRVRVAGDRAMLTVKGKSSGATRSEFEYEIPLSDAHAMLMLCDGPLIEKTRYLQVHAGTTWEVDVFAGDNAGLIVAEVELESETQTFVQPPWLGVEVTHDVRYFNSNLASHPFCKW